MFYVLDGNGEPVPATDEQAIQWFEDGRPGLKVQDTTIGEATVSTVFLGMDHRWGRGSGEPVLWETLVFGGPADGCMNRCSGSRADAHAMHQEMLARVLGLPDQSAVHEDAAGNRTIKPSVANSDGFTNNTP